MTSEMLTELRTLSGKVDTIQTELSQMYKIFVEHLSVCQGHVSEGHDKRRENSIGQESETKSGTSNDVSVEHDLPVAGGNPESPGNPTPGICSVPKRDEEEVFDSQLGNAAENGPSTIPSVYGRSALYSHRSFKECREECLRKSLQQNIVLLVDNLPYSENDILDMLIERECLTETECSDLRNNGSRKDHVRNLVRMLKGRTYKVMKTFIECVKTVHPEVAASVWQVYEKLVKDRKNYSRQCTFCVLKRSVDIKFLADHTWSVGAISDELYEEIVEGRADRETLWTKLAVECNIAPTTIRQNALRKVTEALMKMGQYRELVLKLSKLSFLRCACVKMEVDSLRFPLAESSTNLKIVVTDYDENTSASPTSTPTSSRSFADGSEIISDDDEFHVNQHENYFLSRRAAENDRGLFTSYYRLRQGLAFDQGIIDEELRKSRSNSFGKRGSFRSLDKRRASMFT